MTMHPTKITTLKGIQVEKVVCGPRNTLFLSGGNKLFKTNMVSTGPVRIFERELANHKIVDIAAGSSHFMILNDEGDVYSWGDNDCCQLGIGEGKEQKTPKKIDTLSKFFINRISCGAAHSMAVSKTGNVFVWGSNTRGQLGYDPKVMKFSPVPTKIMLMIKDLNEENGLEISEETKQEIEEEQLFSQEAEGDKKPDLLDQVTHAVCGTWSSIFVTATSKIRLHVWGGENIINSSFVLNNNTSDDEAVQFVKSRGDDIFYMNYSGELFKYSIHDKKAILLEKIGNFNDLSLGSNFMGIVRDDNTLHMKGSNKYGQLGTGDKSNRTEAFEQITTMEPTRVSKVICGISNTVIIAKTEKSQMNEKMADLIICKMFDSDSQASIFEGDPETQRILRIILQSMVS